MNKARSLTMLIVSLLFFAFALAGWGFYLFRAEKAKYNNLQEELGEVEEKQHSGEKKLEEANNTISILQLKLQDMEKEKKSLTGELQQERVAKEGAFSQMEQIRQSLDKQKASRLALEDQLAQSQEEKRKIQSQLQDLESKKAELEVKIKQLEQQSQSVELGEVIVNPEANPEIVALAQSPDVEEIAVPLASLEGQVLVVNKEYNFTVINLGSQDGVKLGNIFSVYRRNSYLGDIKVEKVHDAMAAANFISAGVAEKVNVGDKVVPKN